ncbi:MAG TPA: gamma-glutamyl-gamma-aminobutyrate hydrolase family protein, partial [Candidatus Tripitaka sp. YC43]
MRQVKPFIGINCDLQGEKPRRLSLYCEYYEAVKMAGGIPILLAPLEEVKDIEGLLNRLDGLILSGGDDVWPERYGQTRHARTNLVSKERDTFDFQLVRQALDMDIPMLGICHGIQLINVVMGGTLIQDIPSHSKVTHKVTVGRGTHLCEFIKTDELMVNSSHHQAIDRLGEGLKVSATAEDGIVEAVEGTRHSLVMGVQWHP